MSPSSRSKSKDRKASKELQKASSKPLSHPIAASNTPVNGCSPLLGKFHMLDTTPTSSASPLQVSGRFRNIDETDDQCGNTIGTGMEYETGSNNGSWSGESEDHKEKMPQNLMRQEVVPGADNEKREKIRQKNERKHQRQKERRAQELHERCSGFLMSRKLEALSQKLVAMGFSSERATMALILNEGKIEESVAWLFDGGEEVDEQKENNLDGGNLKIDISEELAQIADMEIRYKCSRQEVERAVVACEGDLEKAAETLRVQKQDQPSAPPMPEETGDPPTVSNGKLSGSGSQNSLRSNPKSASTTMQQKRDEKDFNYTKTAATVGAPVELGIKNVQTSRKVQPKLEWAKPQLGAAVPTDKRWPSAAGTSSISYSLASPLQATPPAAKTESRYVALGSELKNLQLGSVKEPVVVMQRPQSANAKQAPVTSISSSPPGTASSWYPNNIETIKPNGFSPHISSTRSLTPNNLSSSQLYSQLHHQQHPQFMPSSSPADSAGAGRGNGLWNRTVASPLAAASSLGLFTQLGSSLPLGSPPPVDWNTGGSMLQLDYANIDWSLDRRSTSSMPSTIWQDMNSVMPNSAHVYDSYTPGPSGRTAMRPALGNGGGGGGGGAPISRLQDGGVASGEKTGGTGGGSREWSSPFEEKDLFSLPRQFVSSPSL